ncbi:DUF692 domain-containing protein [Uliginosibacterium sediminicola]|uniref:UPF0276 protein ABDB84_08935 n=1 Tax=Uliginosibacterium sediminicola TaxID=2024550 RepID=A0ABU9YXX8_9RHOO
MNRDDNFIAGLHRATPGAGAPMLPLRAGIGLKPQHFRDILHSLPEIGFFEVHAENYMVAGGPFHHYLGRIREHYPLSIHGVGLSIGAEAPPDEAHLDRLAALLERYAPQSFSEHLAWSTHDGRFFNDLLPLVYDRASLQRVCTHIDRVQERLGRRMLLENPASYLEFAASSVDEADFISEVVQRTGCGLLLDVNNVYVSCVNHQRDAKAYLARLPLAATGEIHLAGFARDTDEDGSSLLIDSHGSAVDAAVWALYADVLDMIGPQPTLIERDNDVPALAVLLDEARQAEQLLQVAR